MARPQAQDSELPLFAAAAARKFLTITELNELVKGTLESRLEALWVQGEVSNFRMPPSGHYYFTLKDDKSQIAAVMFRRQGMRLRFTPEGIRLEQKVVRLINSADSLNALGFLL